MRATIPSLPARKARPGSAPGAREAAWLAGPARLWHTRFRWLRTAAILVVIGCVCALAEGPAWHQDTVLAALDLALALAYGFTGLMLRKEPGQGITGGALILAGLFRGTWLVEAWNGPWPAYVILFGAADRLFGAWALLRYPNPSLTRLQRGYMIGLGTWMFVGRGLILVTSTAAWNGNPPSVWWPALAPDQTLSNVLNYVVHSGEGLFAAGLGVLLAIRLVQARGLDRVVIAPITMAGIAVVVAATASAAARSAASLNVTPYATYLAESVADFAVPIAFLIALVQQLLLTRDVAEVTAQAARDGDITTLRHALRDSLRDPTLELLDPSDPSLPPLEQRLEKRSDGRLVSFIGPGQDAPIAIVIADPVLARYRWLFDAAMRTSGLALHNAQLQAKAAREELEKVKISRARIIEAELAERRRLERDLHDGVQQHLLGITAGLTAAMTGTTDPVATAAFGQARDGLKAVLAELRDLAHGIHPATLTQGGLAVALEDIAERLPLPIRISVPARRLDPALEATLYFVACEALANAVKHAQAGSARVTVRTEQSWAEMEISDDGVGGITTGSSLGRGLANIFDRVSALDGAVTIDSPPGRGTRVMVNIPCG
jgi:signal transduction histidine kinase